MPELEYECIMYGQTRSLTAWHAHRWLVENGQRGRITAYLRLLLPKMSKKTLDTKCRDLMLGGDEMDEACREAEDAAGRMYDESEALSSVESELRVSIEACRLTPDHFRRAAGRERAVRGRPRCGRSDGHFTPHNVCRVAKSRHDRWQPRALER